VPLCLHTDCLRFISQKTVMWCDAMWRDILWRDWCDVLECDVIWFDMWCLNWKEGCRSKKCSKWPRILRSGWDGKEIWEKREGGNAQIRKTGLEIRKSFPVWSERTFYTSLIKECNLGDGLACLARALMIITRILLESQFPLFIVNVNMSPIFVAFIFCFVKLIT
jgi:hypothetical protein